ncbi:DUF397 domain-containing protein [Thermobifida halotolerans]|uniref:DUF397 domain-containing protein n=1 Tax=Thermobifida halotolerans TaxID=483545 RepID=A0AA97LZ72_9ACTN|nr:DUF397 domain-containing protein [Thermobifida halotolerans]UOE20825.1 DUF397 domain-containing protein [Thermobifida halotolerans]
MTERLDWHKSSYSGNAGACVEVAVSWRKSSYSSDTGGNCVEVAETPSAVLVRDTQHRDLGHLGFAPAEWVAFLADLKDNRL